MERQRHEVICRTQTMVQPEIKIQQFANENKQLSVQQDGNLPINLKQIQKNKQYINAKMPLSNSIRAGDWVCLVCNNLNFSFRNECNRCLLQTKKQNYMQNMMLINQCKNIQNNQQSLALPVTFTRRPLEDISNQDNILDQPQEQSTSRVLLPVSQTNLNLSIQSYQQQQVQYQQSFITNSQFDNQHSPNLYQPLDTCQQEQQQQPQQQSIGNKNIVDSDIWAIEKGGFQNSVLITPPKFRKHIINYYIKSPKSPVQNKQGDDYQRPYQSPSRIPNVSPILKMIKTEQFNQNEYMAQSRIQTLNKKQYQYYNDIFSNDNDKQDWICLRCKSINYFFKQSCNRCHEQRI